MMPDFYKAQNAATELLLQQNIDSLYIDIRDFKLPNNITIDSLQNFCRLSGFPIAELEGSCIDGACLLVKEPHRIILYDNRIKNERRKNWSIGHELGHIYLNHKDDDRKSEIEAHFFTAQIVMPEIVLWEIYKRQERSLTVSDIYERFNASYEAAAKRLNTINKRQCFDSGSVNKRLLEKFKPILNSNLSHQHIVS